MANKRLNKFKCNILVINKEFTEMNPQEVTIYGSEPIKGSIYPEIIYTIDIPPYIYDRLVDKLEGYDSIETYKKKNEIAKKNGNSLPKKYFKKYVESTLLSIAIKELEDLSQKILELENDKKREGVKKIFVRFEGGISKEKCNWTGGYMGEMISTKFQYFTGYEIESIKSIFEKETLTKKYMTNILYKSGSIRNHYQFESIDTIELGDNFSIYKTGCLHPLYMDNSQSFTNFLSTFKIIDWTQEREDFFETLDKKFKTLNSELNSYLSNLDNDKIDKLIENKNYLQKLLQ